MITTLKDSNGHRHYEVEAMLTTSMSLTEKQVKKLDAEAKKLGRSRSAAMRHVIDAYFSGEKTINVDQRIIDKVAKELAKTIKQELKR